MTRLYDHNCTRIRWCPSYPGALWNDEEADWTGPPPRVWHCHTMSHAEQSRDVLDGHRMIVEEFERQNAHRESWSYGGYMNQQHQIFHIAERSDWEKRTDSYTPSWFDEEGFLHCSTADQLDVVAKAIFSGREDLVLLTIDERALGDLVVYEDLNEVGEKFPHVYGRIPLSVVLRAEPYSVP